jgi:hypothetical protein
LEVLCAYLVFPVKTFIWYTGGNRRILTHLWKNLWITAVCQSYVRNYPAFVQIAAGELLLKKTSLHRS